MATNSSLTSCLCLRSFNRLPYSLSCSFRLLVADLHSFHLESLAFWVYFLVKAFVQAGIEPSFIDRYLACDRRLALQGHLAFPPYRTCWKSRQHRLLACLPDHQAVSPFIAMGLRLSRIMQLHQSLREVLFLASHLRRIRHLVACQV